MNGKTMEKTSPRMAQIRALLLKSIKDVTTFLRHCVQINRENYPTQKLTIAIPVKTRENLSEGIYA